MVRGCNLIYHLKQFSLSYEHFNPDIQLCISPQNSNLGGRIEFGTTTITMKANAESVQFVTFSKTFVSAPTILATMGQSTASAAIWGLGYLSVVNRKTTGFEIKIMNKDNANRTILVHWIAIGK